MRHTFAHDAVVVLDPGTDPGSPGTAITVALCGHWEHPPPCPLAPHHTAARADGDALVLRVLFAADPADEDRVRASIEDALAGGRLTGPDGDTATWQLRTAGPGVPQPTESAHGARLAAS